MKKIKVATIVFYDGIQAYTTHRALFVNDDCKLTSKSKQALKLDFVTYSGMEILKIDFNDCSTYDNASEFMEHFNSIYRSNDDNEIKYVKDKFLEYFIN